MKQTLPSAAGPIGIFDSGYGGLTILSKIREALPQYDYIYLGDNARAPYGTRSFEIVYEFTLQAVTKLFEMGCHLVILACNTASAKALRNIQMNDLPRLDPMRRVLGVIRPTVECIGNITQSRHVGVLATAGTIKSESYPLEVHKLFPDIKVSGEACPLWVSLVENNEAQGEGTDYFIRKNIGNLLAKRHADRHRHSGLHALPVAAAQDTAIHARRHHDRHSGGTGSRQPERLSSPPSGNGQKMYQRWKMRLPHHGIGGEIHRIGFYFPE